MNLVIVESPTKARTIGRFLGKDYEVRASMGHVMDLPKSKLGVDVEHDFAPQYEFIEDKKKIVDELSKLAKTADNILLATDPDREGEAISSHVKDVLTERLKGKTDHKFQRIVFHEITKEAIETALKEPRKVDEHLVEAQTARRVLDRLVGYKISPVLWQKVRRGLSAGRVQSVVVRLVVEREREIEKFKKEPYWTISVTLSTPKKDQTPFELIEIKGKKIEKSQSHDLYDGQYKVTTTTILTEIQANEIIKNLTGSHYLVSDVLQKETRRTPPPPFTTSTLQQDAARRFGYSGKRTMSLAQKLYEEGHITYHRTDSVHLAPGAVTAMRAYVKKEFGDKYLPETQRIYKAKQKLAQEAHEAIRPTKIDQKEAAVAADLGRDYAKVYGLIWRRALGSQMADAITESTTVIVDAHQQNPSSNATPEYRFKAVGSVLVFDGFLKINPQALEDRRLPQFATGEKLTYVDGAITPHETLPPPRYNDASLIKTLEEKGIGRPSTYAAIISTIQDRRYVEKQENRFSPTSVGLAVNDFLVKNFSDIDDVPFTADMEDQLDGIASGEKEWEPMIASFYKTFAKQLTAVKDADRVKIETETVDELCPECNSNLVVRIGKFGKFLSCGRFPECKFSKPFVEETNLMCPKDGNLAEGKAGKIIIKRTRKGRKFYGCSNYPACDFAAWKLEEIKNPARQNI